LDRPDVILGSSVHLLSVLAALILSRLLGSKFVMEIRDLWPQTLVDVGALADKSLVTYLLRKLETYLYKRAERIITLLPRADLYLKEHGVDISKVIWIPNGVDFSLYPVEENKLSIGAFEVLYIGNLGLNALPVLIQAAKIIQDQGNQEITFSIVGEGHKKVEYQLLADQLGLRNLVFEDAIPKQQVPDRLQQADILVSVLRDLDLYQYGISLNKLFDYMAAGKPVILTGNPVNNIVAEAGCGRTAPPDDPQALAEVIVELYHLPAAERERMGRNGRTFVEERYNINLLAIKLRNTLDDLLSLGI
jgi:glycosyltransferase involved in cell wall biosynthesis